jgi:thiosulfate dehydrogenase [quinone] large subunit
MKLRTEQMIWGILRISLGWIFLWAFLDKVFGLGFATQSGRAWLDGVSPTFGYLAYATHGPLAPIFKALAGNAVVDLLFMAGLLLVGLSLIMGIGVRVAAYAGSVMLFLMFLAASLPPEHNPLIDEHIIYILVLLLMSSMPVGDWLGFGNWWAGQSFVKSRPYLR